MTSAEFTQWMAYSNLEPFGYPMDNWRHGINTAAIVNSVRSTIALPKGQPRLKPIPVETFMPTQAKREVLTPKQAAHLERKRQKKRGSKHG